MKTKLKLVGLLILLIGIVSIISITNAQTFQTPTSGLGTTSYQYYEPSYQNFYASQGIDYRTFWPQFQNAATCEPGNDFFVTIPPGGCSPMVVRSDLLEDQNVPVFCKLTAIRTNPIVDVAEIRSVTFAGQYPNEVVGISYHPSQAVLRSYNPNLGSSIVNEVGYIVVLLKQQPSERNISDEIRFNLTANIQYDLRNIQGIGKSTFFLPVMSDSDWQNDYIQYGFWQGKGFVRVEYVDADRAKITIYSDSNTVVRSFDLTLGQTSDVLYVPGFYCRGGVRIALRNIGVPKKSALLQVEDEKLWLTEGSKFLERCFVEKIESTKTGEGTEQQVVEKVSLRCDGKQTILTLTERAIEGQGLEDKNIASGSEQQIDEYFENAKKTAYEIAEFYSSDTISDKPSEMVGAQALFELAETADSIGKSKTAKEIYEKIIKEYPDSSQAQTAREKIDFADRYDKSQASSIITVAGKSYPVTLENIDIPDKSKAGVEFTISQGTLSLLEGEAKAFGQDNKENIKLVKILDSSNIVIDYTYKTTTGEIKTESGKQIKEGETLAGTSITLKEVNFERAAGIELLPEFPNQVSKVNVSVNIGIEKRGIKLSPSKMREKIDALNESIEKYTKIADRLEDWVEGQSKVCLATSTILLVKNLFQNFGGKGLARNKVMNEEGGWNKKCATKEMLSIHGSVDNCIFANRQAIENDVNAYSTRVQEINKNIGNLETATKTTGNFDERFTKEQFAKFVQDNPGLQTGIKDKNGKEQTLGQYFDSGDADTIWKMKQDGKITVSQMKDIMLYGGLSTQQQQTGQIINEFASKSLGSTVQQVDVLQGKAVAYDADIKPGECNNAYKNPQIKIYGSGSFKGKAQLVPIDENKGWYAATRPDIYGVSTPYTEAGQVLSMYLCNVGKNGLEEWDSSSNDDRPCIQINLQIGQPLGQNPCFKDQAEATALARKAKTMLEQASSRYTSGARSVAIESGKFETALSAAIAGAKCTDFMSALDCKILFNICDPVLCPASRCNFGGQYPVANVIQSGIIGSALLCLPNFKDGIVIPVCLTGIKEGIKGYVSLLTSHRDCLQESLTTGKQVGICDEMYSIYLCEFVWRQAGPLIDVGILKLAEMMLGQNRGGAEYMTANSAWDSMKESVNFLRNTYTSEIPRLFQTRAVGEIGSQVCQGFISANYPIIGDLADTMLNPESPVQFHATFNEIPYSDVTVPPTSQYDVYYHIYAGSDAGAYYSVYLKKTPELGYYAEQAQYVISQGYVGAGQSADEKKDFTAPAGYKELCININGQEECGFKQVSSSFALDYMNDQFMKQQSTDMVESEQECVSGSPSFYSLLQPNIQAGVEEMIQPGIYNRGIVRVCSTDDPGKVSEPGRWENVGVCDEGKKIYCWLDTKSVKEAIIFNETEQRTFQEIGKMATDFQVGEGLILDESKALSELVQLKEELTNLEKMNIKVLEEFMVFEAVYDFTTKADTLVAKGYNNQIKANALYLKFEGYKMIVDKLKSEFLIVKEITSLTQLRVGQIVNLAIPAAGGYIPIENAEVVKIDLQTGEFEYRKIENGQIVSEGTATLDDIKKYYTISQKAETPSAPVTQPTPPPTAKADYKGVIESEVTSGMASIGDYTSKIDEYASIACFLSEEAEEEIPTSAVVSGVSAMGAKVAVESFATELSQASTVLVETGTQVFRASGVAGLGIEAGSVVNVPGVAGSFVRDAGQIIGKITTGGKVANVAPGTAHVLQEAGYVVKSGVIRPGGIIKGLEVSSSAKLVDATGKTVGSLAEGTIAKTSKGTLKFIPKTSKFFSVLNTITTVLTFYEMFCTGLEVNHAIIQTYEEITSAQASAYDVDAAYGNLVLAGKSRFNDVISNTNTLLEMYEDNKNDPQISKFQGNIDNIKLFINDVQQEYEYLRNMYVSFSGNENREKEGAIIGFRVEIKITNDEGVDIMNQYRVFSSALRKLNENTVSLMDNIQRTIKGEQIALPEVEERIESKYYSPQSNTITLVFNSGSNDYATIRWNFETEQVMINLKPNGKDTVPAILSSPRTPDMRTALDSLLKSSVVTNDMYPEDIVYIRRLLESQSPSELSQNIRFTIISKRASINNDGNYDIALADINVLLFGSPEVPVFESVLEHPQTFSVITSLTNNQLIFTFAYVKEDSPIYVVQMNNNPKWTVMLDTKQNRAYIYDYDSTKPYNLGSSAGNEWLSLFYTSQELSPEADIPLDKDANMLINAYNNALMKNLS